MMILLLLFIALYGTTVFGTTVFGTTVFGTTVFGSSGGNKGIEGFTDETTNDADVDEDEEEEPTPTATEFEIIEEDEETQPTSSNPDEEVDSDEITFDEEETEPTGNNNNNNNNMRTISEREMDKIEEEMTDKKIERYKDIILGPMKKMSENADNEYKKGLIENKKIMYESIKKDNKYKNASSNDKNNKNINSNGNNNTRRKENFQTIKPRKFDPTNEDDTNLLITKEILGDMNNRIQYNYENKDYLKKYLKHRIEEMVDINKLLNDDDE
jgi:hypothetical protein